MDLYKQSALGKTSHTVEIYSPKLLQAIPRELQRKQLSIENITWYGQDTWFGYELSWLNGKGKPVVAIIKIEFPLHSPYLIESKSLKLYLNSLVQTRFDLTFQVTEAIKRDLSRAVKTEVSVKLYDVEEYGISTPQQPPGECIDHLDIEVDSYEYSRHWLLDLLSNKQQLVDETLYSHLLKTNCLVTKQPDWGSVIIRYVGPKINREALLKYLISFRRHDEFHEHCIERIFTDLWQMNVFGKLSIQGLYTRRGGLDINPFRSSEPCDPLLFRSARQ